jgi:hypothetical protein
MNNIHDNSREMHGSLEGLSTFASKIGSGVGVCTIFVISILEGMAIGRAIVLTIITSTIGFFLPIFWRIVYNKHLKKWLEPEQ